MAAQHRTTVFATATGQIVGTSTFPAIAGSNTFVVHTSMGIGALFLNSRCPHRLSFKLKTAIRSKVVHHWFSSGSGPLSVPKLPWPTSTGSSA